tara:strand:- start:1022 stop:2104 length:1083 start_codon:yes stop_codon:yes gene_type:complete
MKVCIIGDSLTSLALAKALVNREIFVDIFLKKKNIIVDTTRTIGISKSNIDYFNKNITNINRLLWKIKKIKIYSENSEKDSIIQFKNQKDPLFSILKNHKLVNQLTLELKKNKFINFKKNTSGKHPAQADYDLLINSDLTHKFTKKYFSKKFEKKYNSVAYTTIINHKKISLNNTAVQIFTNKGPIAFLPISNEKTSVVYSIRLKNFSNDLEIKNMINKFNSFYEIKKINEISKFELSSFNLREYYRGNILAFGDLLHKLHPLAGQGFNMSIRDIKVLLEIIDSKISLGLPIDKNVCIEFQNKTKSKNFLFSNGIDLIYELFNSENKIRNNLVDSTVKLFGKNKLVNRYFKSIADEGLQV